ncbi:MAG: phage holin family protein [Weeksellaceae bacterium]|jgi:hypothetical protein|nr:phage holin family protein [Weeksellaceae bacterium]MDX9704838.1 phage holin family protein [Weeksellaceae bacterium]
MFDDLKKYLNQRINYAKLEVIDSLSSMISLSVYGILILMLSLLILFISSLSFGFLLGKWFDNFGIGFLILTAFYLLLFFVIYLFRAKIRLYITNKIIKTAIETLDKSEKESNGY